MDEERPTSWVVDRRLVWVALGCAMAAAAAVILWLGRGATYWGDELAWVMESPDFSFADALRPHNGHLVLTSRVTYKLILEGFGSGYLPFQLLAVGANLLMVALFFVYVSRRVGAVVALAPCLVLLIFGSDSLHVLLGNGFTVLFSLACGIGALLALERDDWLGDAAACVLLCLGVVTYTVALAFVVGATILILAGGDRWRRAWVVVVPVAIYGTWWLWTFNNGISSEGAVSVPHVLLTPAWGFQALSETLGALSGLQYPFSGLSEPALNRVGPVLALLAILGFVRRLKSRPVPRALWATVGVIVALWLSGAVTASPTAIRFPEEARFLYPGALAALLVGANAVAGMRWSRGATLTVFVVAAVALATNLTLLRETATQLRGVYTVQTRAALTAVEISDRRTGPDFEPPPPIDVELPIQGVVSPLLLPFSSVARYESASRAYLSAVRRYGPLGFSIRKLREQGEQARAQTDSVLVAALELKLVPASPSAAGGRCTTAHPSSTSMTRLPRGRALLTAGESGTEVQVRRFADSATVTVGYLLPNTAALLRVPPDGSRTPWWVHAPTSKLVVCALR